MFKHIMHELEHHAPFTFAGAISGIIFMLLFKNLPHHVSHTVFYILHPTHVLLSALVTASMYCIYKRGNSANINFFSLAIIGYVGSVGIATLSDSLIPYLGEFLLKMPHRHTHIGFIEKWWLINPLAFAGIIIAYFAPTTKFPHAGHVLISTWASLFHILMAKGDSITAWAYLAILVFLFLAVWFPCCLSDIIFPLLFVDTKDIHKHIHTHSHNLHSDEREKSEQTS